MDNPNSTYRVIRLAVENYKRLRAADVTPSRHAVIVAGKNRQGKTSLLDSIAAALGGRKQVAEEPVRSGAESGTILCVLGDERGELLVKRTFTADGKTALEITSGEGYKAPSPQAILDGLCSSIAFDPLSFTRMTDKAQLEALRELVGLDFSGLDAERKKLYDHRTEINRDAKRLKAQADGVVIPEGTPEAPVSVMSLMLELKRRNDVNAANRKNRDAADRTRLDVDSIRATRDQKRQAVSDLEAKLVKARDEAESADNDLVQAEALLAAAVATANVLEDQDVGEVDAQIIQAQSVNEAVSKRGDKKKLLEEAAGAEAEAAGLTAKIDAIDAEKQKALSEVAWPIEGLAFGESGVLYNGHPFSQASGAEQLSVSFAMSAAAHPRLKIALLRDASLLDEEQMATVCAMAEQYDTQLWMEVVDRDAGPCGILIEDGSVVSGGTPAGAAPVKKSRKKAERELPNQEELPFME